MSCEPQAEPARKPAPVPLSVLAQRRSSSGDVATMSAPPIVDAGRPLDRATRASMESGFGHSFGSVRVHDDARAHDNARSLNARAYTAGDHIVFAEGAYRPGTAAGNALIAHELAHTVQQGGVQMKADGPMPAAADHEMEAQADRAAAAVTAGRPAPTLSRVGVAAVFRNAADQPAPTATPATTGTVSTKNLPSGMTEVPAPPDGVDALYLEVDNFQLPVEKGMGDWVQKAWTEAANGKRTVFLPLIEGGRVAAYKEGTEDYQSIWLKNFGFTSMPGLSLAFKTAAPNEPEVKAALADPAVSKLVTAISGGLKAAGCDIDHIVEKQVGGTSIPSNLQLLVSNKNQASGRDTYNKLKDLVEAVRAPGMRGPGVKKLQLRLKSVVVPPGTSDASYVVESLLRAGKVKGKDAVIAAAQGKPVTVSAGGVGETLDIKDKGVSLIEVAGRRAVPGMRLTTYTRGPMGPAGKQDTVEGELDSRAIAKTGATEKEAQIKLLATLDAQATAGAAAGGQAAAANAASGEARKLTMPTGAKKIRFYYPYLSPGELITAKLDEQGRLSGTGVIHPSVKFLGDIKVSYGPDTLTMDSAIDVKNINSSKFMQPLASMFRFTGGSVSIDLMKFKPEGSLQFSMGPAAKPVILGDITTGLDGGEFFAKGTLKPGASIPGIKDASGDVEYRASTGWSGKLTASSATFAASSVNVALGFQEDGGKLVFKGTGGITTKIRDKAELTLNASWNGSTIGYSGSVEIEKPLPFLKSVRLRGGYRDNTLSIHAENVGFTWKNIDSTINVHFVRKDGEEGAFSGDATVIVKTEKADGSIKLNFDEQGKVWGEGWVSYQITKAIRPKLGVKVTRDTPPRVKLFGEVEINDIKVFDAWPKAPNDRKSLLKADATAYFPIPPLPVVTATLTATGELGAKYSVGPGLITGVKINAECYPLEDDPKIVATLTGKFLVPATAGLYGRFGVMIGVAVGPGVVGARGGVFLVPEIGVKGEGGVQVNAEYKDAGFSFDALAYAKGAMYGSLGVEFQVELYAAAGLVKYDWTFPAAKWGPKTIGPELYVTLGKIGYARDGTITWPSLSQIEVTPKEFDPIELVKDIMRSSKTDERGGSSSTRATPPREYGPKW